MAERSKTSLSESEGVLQTRIPTHDFGMVGFIKHCVDEVMSSGIRPSMTAVSTRPDRLQLMHVHKSMVVLRKAGTMVSGDES